MVLVSVVIGLGIVHLLAGAARFLTGRGEWKPYWVHLLWTWNVFNELIFFWWFVWRWKAVQQWSLLLFLFIIGYSVLMYLLCAVLYPETDERHDFRQIYYDNRGIFFGLWILAMVVDFFDTHLKMHYGLSGFGMPQYLAYAAILTGSGICMRSTSHRVHATWGILFLINLSSFELANFSVLRAN